MHTFKNPNFLCQFYVILFLNDSNLALSAFYIALHTLKNFDYLNILDKKLVPYLSLIDPRGEADHDRAQSLKHVTMHVQHQG